MTVAYWVLAALLGAFYLFAGGKKLAQSKEQLAPMMGWVDRTPMWLVRVIGVVEVAGCWRPDPAARDRCRSCPGVGGSDRVRHPADPGQRRPSLPRGEKGGQPQRRVDRPSRGDGLAPRLSGEAGH